MYNKKISIKKEYMLYKFFREREKEYIISTMYQKLRRKMANLFLYKNSNKMIICISFVISWTDSSTKVLREGLQNNIKN